MPFVLKNVGATYMRAMNTLFHDMIHKEIEVYVDDVIIKTKQQPDHVGDVRKCFLEASQFRSIEFRNIPRIYNEVVDALATLALMLHHPDKAYVDPLHIQVRDQHVYCNVVEEEIDGKPWFHDIQEYIRMMVYPVQASGDQKGTIRRLASRFFLSGGILQKRNPDLGLLRYIDVKQDTIIMTEVHSGVSGPHMSGYVLAKKILRANYYWLTMERDCIIYVRKCHQCHVHDALIHSSPSELHTIYAPWPFVAWGMDAIGPIEPATSNGHRFILVAIDYFTKWVEAMNFKSVTKKEVVDFVHSNIICQFGIPKENGAVEAANKNIKKILRKMVQVDATPYLLVYGTEAVIPVEVEIPFLRIVAEAEIDNDEWVKPRLEQLSLIDEKSLAAVCHGQLYQKRMERAYNKKLHPQKFEVGQQVLKHILPHQAETKGKCFPKLVRLLPLAVATSQAGGGAKGPTAHTPEQRIHVDQVLEIIPIPKSQLSPGQGISFRG
ncbi:uncharacterized protein [Nicotiana sylvestris]|uniref:uncharacterized protein n=1 Tax=Nicotiana sylvestris TaxID=4096 RepID=UPI00388CD22C